MGRSALGAVLLALLMTAAAADAVLYVDGRATGAGDGSSWADAYTDLQAALAATAAGELWVAEGTYTPAAPGGDVNATFQLKSGVALYGGFRGTETTREARDPAAAVTVLSGDLLGDDLPGFYNQTDNSRHVVTGDGTDPTARLDGFTVTGGRAVFSTSWGAGIYIHAGSPTIANCEIADNLAVMGAGLYNRDGSPTIVGCTFRGNYAYDGYGGGLVNTGAAAHATVADTVFRNNRVTRGANQAGGGAVYNDGVLDIADSVFIGNTGGFRPASGDFTVNGGAIMNFPFAAGLTVVRSRFLGNSAHNGGAVASYGNAAFVDCLFSGNRAVHSDQTDYATGSAGAFFQVFGAQSPIVTIANSTLAGNHADEDAGGIYAVPLLPDDPTTMLVANAILWGNTDVDGGGDVRNQRKGSVTIEDSIVEGADADPLFASPVGPDGIAGTLDDDLRLRAGSPAIDAGRNAVRPAGLSSDLDGNARFTDDPATPDTGAGTPPIVDLGPYEFGAAPVTTTTTTTTTTTSTTLPPAGGALVVTRAVLRGDTAASDARGRVKVVGTVTTSAAIDVGAGLAVRFTDGLAFDVTGTFASSGCVVSSSGRIRCKGASGKHVASLAPVAKTPGLYKLSVQLKALAETAPFAPPVTVTMTYGAPGIELGGAIADCTASTNGLRCR